MNESRAAKPARAAKTFVVSLENKKARGSGHERKQEIADAAKALFLTRGIENVSTRQIAEGAGISQTALYVYFENKQAILSYLTDAAFKKLGDVLAAVEQQAGDPLAYLEQALPTYIRFGLEHPDEYRIAFMMFRAGPDAGAADAGARKSEEGLAAFASLSRQVVLGVERGLIRRRHAQPEAVAQSVWASIHGLVAVLLAFPGFDWIAVDDLIAVHTQLLMDGLTLGAA